MAIFLVFFWWVFIPAIFQMVAAYRYQWRGLLIAMAGGLALVLLGTGLFGVYARYTAVPGGEDRTAVFASFMVAHIGALGIAAFILAGTALVVREFLIASLPSDMSIHNTGKDR